MGKARKENTVVVAAVVVAVVLAAAKIADGWPCRFRFLVVVVVAFVAVVLRNCHTRGPMPILNSSTAMPNHRAAK